MVLDKRQCPRSTMPRSRCNRREDSAHCDRDFAVNPVPKHGEVDEFSIEGTGEFAAGGVLVLDELLESLGPYAVEAAVLIGEYENEPCTLVVARNNRGRRNCSEPLPPGPDQANAS